MYILFIYIYISPIPLGGGLFLLLYTICMHVLVVGYLSPYSGGGTPTNVAKGAGGNTRS